ncbi:sensor domain-containing diguanylate cyclase [Vibrio albus]|uniref:diguanylate cyclase n=1 Tax=Vibrio albus TaxID=2200953 RepID=A0A2U3BAQ7_9VIBR|nr:sensor domain-containing diguanylate cyclase [Vibrio albus]PWI33867.1 sensor domain-containing diguanylate cyclase [Vibrio albus]
MDKDNKEHEEYAAIISALPDMVFILTESGHYADILGGEDSDFYHDGSPLIGASLFDVLPQDKAEWFLARIRETLEADKLMLFEYSLAVDDVESVDPCSGPAGCLWFEGRVNPLRSLRNGERAVVWVARNITDHYNLLRELRFQSEIDPLSGALNRRKLFEHLKEDLYAYQRYEENYCFLLLDIDDFKQINDTWGHQCGDEAIQYLVSECRSELRYTDVIGRLGGDEFAIIHKYVSQGSPQALAERIMQVVRGISAKHELDFNLSISIGISVFHESDIDVNGIYRRADLAVYQAKDNGKNGYCMN